MLVAGYQGEWNTPTLVELIRRSVPYCDYFLLMVVQGREHDAHNLIRDLKCYLVTHRMVDVWPGTVSLDGKLHEMLKFTLNENSLHILVDKILPETFQPEPALEDISLLRADGRPFLVTITHERDAFFCLDPEEWAAFTAGFGPYQLIIQAEAPALPEKY